MELRTQYYDEEPEIMIPEKINTRCTVLRRFQLEDLDDIAKVLGHPDVMQFSLDGPFTREQSKSFVEKCLDNYKNKGFGLFAVVDKIDRIVIGYCGFYFQLIEGVEMVEIGYRLHPNYWNRGIATEVSKAVQEYGSNQLGLEKMISIIEAENKASIRVAEKNGFKFEKEVLFKDKIPVRIYAIEKSD
jgi:[ribosomal protein S5]-alanine N-acetyltransferase